MLIAYQIGEYNEPKKMSEFSRLRREALLKYGNRALHDRHFNAEYLGSPWAAVYIKAPTIIRMFHKALGTRFEPRLFFYLKQNLYSNVNSSLLIKAMTKDNERNERAMFSSFIFNADAPLIEIFYQSKSRSFEITQSPFEFRRKEVKWTVPIWFRRKASADEELVWANAQEDVVSIQLNDQDEPRDFIFDAHCEAFAVYHIEIDGRKHYYCHPNDNEETLSSELNESHSDEYTIFSGPD